MSNIKVSIMFTLVGKTLDVPTRKASRYLDDEEESIVDPHIASRKWDNEDSLGIVIQKVNKHFGATRPLIVINEDILSEERLVYPDFFCAGWFVSSDGKAELVVVDHGNSLELANKSMMTSVTKIDWEALAGPTGL